MKTAKVFFFVALLTVTAAANFGVGIFEPEISRDVALRQFESSDSARQQMRALHSSRQTAIYVLDASVPLVFAALFGSEILAGLSTDPNKGEQKK